MCVCVHVFEPAYSYIVYTVDREIFTIKIICMKNFRDVKFSRFRLIHESFLTVDGYNMDKRLEHS